MGQMPNRLLRRERGICPPSVVHVISPQLAIEAIEPIVVPSHAGGIRAHRKAIVML
jgi:hypothetical protein